MDGAESGARLSDLRHLPKMKAHAALAIWLCLLAPSPSRANGPSAAPEFSDYPISVYNGALHIPSYFTLDSSGVWRDDLGKEVAPVQVNFAGKYYLGLHSCGSECRYFTLSDLSTGRESKALDMFSAADGKPPRTRDGRGYVTELIVHPNSTMLLARYQIDGSADHPSECRERVFVLSHDGNEAKPVTPTAAGCK